MAIACIATRLSIPTLHTHRSPGDASLNHTQNRTNQDTQKGGHGIVFHPIILAFYRCFFKPVLELRQLRSPEIVGVRPKADFGVFLKLTKNPKYMSVHEYAPHQRICFDVRIANSFACKTRHFLGPIMSSGIV